MEQKKNAQWYIDYWKDKIPNLSKAIESIEASKELNTCKLCRYWDNSSQRWAGQIGIESEGFCKNKIINAQVSFGYGDGKCFNEDFGCVHHELIDEIDKLINSIPDETGK